MVWGQRERAYFRQVQVCTILFGKAEPGCGGELSSIYNTTVTLMMYLEWLQDSSAVGFVWFCDKKS